MIQTGKNKRNRTSRKSVEINAEWNIIDEKKKEGNSCGWNVQKVMKCDLETHDTG